MLVNNNIKEWDNPINPFNSMKVLFHAEQLKQISDGIFPPPVSCDTDGSNICNLRCVFCNSQVYRENHSYESMPPGHLIRLADFYASWGIRSTCIGGGGESLINPEIKNFIPYVHNKGIQVGLITNGTLLDDEYAMLTSEHARFVGISCNAATASTYGMMHGAALFNLVISNVERLNRIKHSLGSQLDTNLKFLIHPINYKEVYAVAKLAKDLGCSGVHIRPVAIEGVAGIDPGTGFDMSACRQEIEEQLDRAMTDFNDQNFKVYGVRHKMGDNMERVIRFKQCLATPLNLTFGADGWTYVCFNQRGKESMRLARHYPDPNEILKVWGTDQHKQILAQIKPAECPRCTYGLYHQLIEQAIRQDNMFRFFV